MAFGAFIIKKAKKAPYGRDLVFGLENNASPHLPLALGPILEKAPYDLQLMVADQLAQVHTVAKISKHLVRGNASRTQPLTAARSSASNMG